MKVFLAGASGVIGRPLTRALVEGGHTVVGTTRSAERAEEIRSAGAEPVVLDALVPDAVREAVVAAAPDAVVNQLTALPREYRRRDLERSFPALARIRSQGTANLVAGMEAAGCRRLISQSIAFIYEPAGPWVADEDAPLQSEAPGPYGENVRGVRELERLTLALPEGCVLRYGNFYGPGTYWSREGTMGQDARKRRLPIVGRGDATFSFLHVEDAVSATIAALDSGVNGVFNVTDDEPAPMRDVLPVWAAAVGARKPRRAPLWIARLIAGREMAEAATTLRGASNARFKHATGWQPRYASWRKGFAEGL